MAKRFFLIDGHSHIYRSFYAIPRLTNTHGLPTNATYGFTRMILKLLREEKPDYLAVVLDSKEPSFRRETFEDYKAQRKPMPEEMVVQLPWIRKVLEVCRVAVAAQPSYEADDLMGTLAHQAAEKGIDVFLATSDKDALQLLGEHVQIYETKTSTTYSAADLKEEHGITPEQVPDVLGLAGDTSDNIPGVTGIGMKTAFELVREWGGLEGVLGRIDEVRGKKRQENLRRDAEQARMSKELATIDLQAPCPLSLEDCAVQGPDAAQMRDVFQELNFQKLVSELTPALAPGAIGADSKDGPTGAIGAGITDGPAAADYRLILTEKDFKKLLADLKKAKAFSFDLETTSESPIRADLVGLSFAWKPGEAYYVPVQAAGRKTLPKKRVLQALRPLLEDPKLEIWGQNLKYDALVLRREGIHLDGITFDTMLAAYLIDPGRQQYNLDDLALEFLQYEKIPTQSLLGRGKDQITMDLVDLDSVCRYACEDADVVCRLRRILRPKLEDAGLMKLFREVELPLMRVLEEMEWNGICLDRDVLKAMSKDLAREMERLEKEIHKLAGHEFKINSPKQLSIVLFEELKLPAGRRTKTGYSTNASVLEELAPQHPLPAKVVEYRQVSKLQSTYVEALPKMIEPRTGKVHTSFHQTGTATGRLSSSHPNLQNIPIRTELGRKIRQAFVPSEPDYLLLSADYSQIELRLLAHLSGDRTLRDAFRRDADIHTFVAAQVFGVDPNEVDPEQRRRAKAINFGIIYGQTPFGLALSSRAGPGLSISRGEAKQFIDTYFERYPAVRQYIDQVIAQARETGEVRTLLGRYRRLPSINSSNDNDRKFAERMAINTTVQGSAADFVKVAMLHILRRLEETKSRTRLLLQVHDELLFEVPKEEAEAASEMIETEMTSAIPLDVPVGVHLEMGKNWSFDPEPPLGSEPRDRRLDGPKSGHVQER